MLLVKASCGPSSIHGIGLIARESIPKGTLFWRFEPGFDLALSPDFVRTLSPSAQERVMWYAYFDQARNAFMLSGDDDRFTNHSDTPNTSHHDNEGYSGRDIDEGEEITGDYKSWGGNSPDYNWQILRAAATANGAP